MQDLKKKKKRGNHLLKTDFNKSLECSWGRGNRKQSRKNSRGDNMRKERHWPRKKPICPQEAQRALNLKTKSQWDPCIQQGRPTITAVQWIEPARNWVGCLQKKIKEENFNHKHKKNLEKILRHNKGNYFKGERVGKQLNSGIKKKRAKMSS